MNATLEKVPSQGAHFQTWTGRFYDDASLQLLDSRSQIPWRSTALLSRSTITIDTKFQIRNAIANWIRIGISCVDSVIKKDNTRPESFLADEHATRDIGHHSGRSVQ
jgi:hypothetical protein